MYTAILRRKKGHLSFTPRQRSHKNYTKMMGGDTVFQSGGREMCEGGQQHPRMAVSRGIGLERDAEFILPEEAWKIIFDLVTDWADLLNCSRTCLLFHKLLHRCKTTFLFDRIFPFLFQHLPGNAILKCRSICKDWNEGVDNFLENHPSRRPHDDINCDLQHLPFMNPMREKRIGESYFFGMGRPGIINGGVTIRDPSFYSRMVNSHRNPFIGRAVSIEVSVPPFEHRDEGIDEEYFHNLYKLLETFGKHIFYLTVHIDLGHDRKQILEKMADLLNIHLFRLVPNLRSLRLIGSLEGLPSPKLPTLPRAKNLESLGVSLLEMEDHPLPGMLVGQFHSQLKKLNLHSEAWKRGIYKMEWPELVELHLEEMMEEDDFDGLLQLKMPKLKKLGLKADQWAWMLDEREDFISFDKLLDILGKVVNNTQLSSLRIQGKICQVPNHFEDGTFYNNLLHNDPTRFMASQLQTLEISYYPGTCHSFLLRFPYLEKLNLFREEICRPRYSHSQGQGDKEHEERELVEVNKWVLGGKMYKSNIWKVMPCLKLFTFHRDIYSRHGYERYSEKLTF